jgi:hypothetical protein
MLIIGCDFHTAPSFAAFAKGRWQPTTMSQRVAPTWRFSRRDFSLRRSGFSPDV